MILNFDIKINTLHLHSSIVYHSIIKIHSLTPIQKNSINKHKSYGAKSI